MIPKIIHQIWLGPADPPMKWLNSWRDMHVTSGWEYRLWRDKDVTPLVNDIAYELAPEYCRKADILRYEILYNHGGVYIDADTFCLKNIDPLLKIDEKIFAVMENKYNNLVANGVIGCTKHNVFMKEVINNITHDLSLMAWEATGPKFFTRMIETSSVSVKLYPFNYFWPFHHSEIYPDLSDQRCNDSYGVHYWGTTHDRYGGGIV